MKPKLRTVQVSPVLPKPLEALHTLAFNLHWDWNPEISSLFSRVDPELWERTSRNPVALLGLVDQRRLESLTSDIGFMAHLGRAKETLEQYMQGPRWFQTEHVGHSNIRVAYFSAEFGLASCLPIYSGGLGLLAGDHLKSASDLGIPLVGVGLLYQEGYFRQYLNADGWQMETYPPNDFYNMPIRLQKNSDGSVVKISVEFPGRLVYAQVWRVDVGRVPLYLLDTNVPDNSDTDRGITRALYSGGVELRIQQLMLLGIGGFRALVAMGIEPTVCHMNEGHAGFLGVERTRHLMRQRSLSYELARELTEDGNIFTTHTPVPAGFDVFNRELVERHMSDYMRAVGLSVKDFMALGRRNKEDDHEPFNMAILAIRHAVLRNGVSRLHGVVSRRLVQSGGAWTQWPLDEVPIDHVTNGVHTRTWVAPQMGALFDRYVGPNWKEEPHNHNIWQSVDKIPSEELWRTHVDLRQQLVSFVRKRLAWQLERRGGSKAELEQVAYALNPDALTIGFARRVATYKRATLLFSDPERLKAIITNARRPVQFIFSGKAHPADLPGKEFIKQIASKLKDPSFANSIVFLEDYDIEVAKHLIQGVDIWLNNPQRPKEASGTSGMKVVPNGGLNFSILDGWWAEGYTPSVGWAIGNGEDHVEGRDGVEANALYTVLESQIVPTFYDRDFRSVPHGWVEMMRNSMKGLAAQFSTDRMVKEYCDRFYLPTAERYSQRASENQAEFEAIFSWKQKIRGNWNEVRVLDIRAEQLEARMGQEFPIRAWLRLGGLAPDDVDVQLYCGALDAKNELHQPRAVSMQVMATHNGEFEYGCKVPFDSSGRFGYTVRVVPKHAHVLVPNELTRIRWAEV